MDRIIWQTWRFTRTRTSSKIESLFNITQKLMLEHSEEILNVKPLERSSPSWTRSVFSHDQAIMWTKTKIRVYSDSVLCVGQMNESKEAITRWDCQVEEFKRYPSYKELLGIDGQATEFGWNIFPGFSSLQILQEIQRDLKRKSIEPKEFTDRIIFMSIFNDIDWAIRANDEMCIADADKVKDYPKKFLQGHWTFLGPGSEKKGYGEPSYPPNGERDSTANKMVQRFKETGHPVL